MTQDIDVGKLAEQINDKADRDLWNTVPNVWNNTLNTSQITNCITEIPQDIKLELADGVLTLKAGSKVYVPNGKNADGSLKFDEVVVASDITHTNTSGYIGSTVAMLSPSGFILTAATPLHCSSGSDWTATEQYNARYNTDDNIIKWTENTGNTWSDFNLSLPFALVYVNGSSSITSIDQVFNGFGYIGSTIYALPGVKGLIPNGRNEDGSLKNIEFTLNKVVLGTYADTLTTSGEPMLVGDNQGNITRIDYKNVYGKDYWHYEEAENKWYFAKNQKNWAEIGSAKWSSGVITSFAPKTTFHAVDYNNVTRHQVVSVLPVNPDPNTFYYIPEE